MGDNLLLGVNIDHIATLRQARGTRYPDPVQAAIDAESSGADKITLHLREDRRHIQPRDVLLIKEIMQTSMNLEVAVIDEMIEFAEQVKPQYVCLVPEKREELTTEGGLDVLANYNKVESAVKRLSANGSELSLFIDPDIEQINAAKAVGAHAIELHTGCYADAKDDVIRNDEVSRIKLAAKHASKLNLIVNAGHGLHYHNVKPIAQIPELHELNIGHAIIARALFCGLQEAVRLMRQLMNEART